MTINVNLARLNGIDPKDFEPKDRVADVEEVADMAYVNSELALAMIDMIGEV